MKLHRIEALLYKYWCIATADLTRVFDMVYWPILGVIVFGFTAVYFEKATTLPSIMVYLLGGLILFILFERIQQDVTVLLLEDFWSRNIANLFLTPVTAAELFIALALVALIRVIITTVLLFGIAFIAYQFSLFGGHFTALLFIIPLIIFGWALGILSLAVVFRYGPRIQVVAWSFTMLLQPIGAVFYPLAALPKALQILSYGTPLMYTFEGYRLAYAGTFSWLYLIAGIVIAIIYLIICYLVFVIAIRHAKKSGLLTKN